MVVKGGRSKGVTRSPRTAKTTTLDLEEQKISIMKAEVHYFKGLAVFLTIILVCIILAFGSLFGAMYYETRLMRISLERVLGEALPKIVVADQSGEKQPTLAVSDDEEYLTLEQLGFKISYPKQYSYVVKETVNQVHFFKDGEVRSLASSDTGDMIVSLTKNDNYAGKGKREVALVGDHLGSVYAEDNGLDAYEAVVVKTADGYMELKFTLKKNGQEIVTPTQERQMRELFVFVKE